MRASESIRAQDTVRSCLYGVATRHLSTLRVLPKGGNGIRIADLYAYKSTVYRLPLQYKGGKAERLPPNDSRHLGLARLTVARNAV